MLSVFPEDRSKDAWIAAAWKQEYPDPPDYIDTYRTQETASREKASREKI